jgi:hypothetical protein
MCSGSLRPITNLLTNHSLLILDNERCEKHRKH